MVGFEKYIVMSYLTIEHVALFIVCQFSLYVP